MSGGTLALSGVKLLMFILNALPSLSVLTSVRRVRDWLITGRRGKANTLTPSAQGGKSDPRPTEKNPHPATHTTRRHDTD